MPLSSIQAAIGALIVGIGNAVVALGIIGVETATKDETIVVGAIASLFLLANAIIHHGVTTATGKDPHA